ncbi:MAG TPA: methyltransferase domain-containing protein [Cellvibrionaceae bacterium]|nr:methyltransferase domain-containing protein [Cellvibrionaceae bacterium]
MPPKHPDADRNFNDLTPRFKRNIYDSLKGVVRLRVLQRDFDQWLEPRPQRWLDVGAGQGQFALQLAAQGHQVTLVDISSEMLAQAKQAFTEAGLLAQADFICCPLQQMPEFIHERFDGVMCHAVMEWLQEPELLLPQLTPYIKPGGWLSVIFYNVHGVVFKNLLRTNYKKINAGDFRGKQGSLTPLNPLDPAEVIKWFEQAHLSIRCHSGIRVFHDYILDKTLLAKQGEPLIEQELAFSQRLPYRDLGRYIHLLARKN